MLKIRIWLVLGSLVFAAAMGIVATVAWMSQDPPPPVDLADAQPQAAAAATLVANAYLDGQPAPVPVADDVQGWPTGQSLEHQPPQWNGFDTIKFPSGLSVERHRFLFYRNATIDGKPGLLMYELVVPMAISSVGTPALAGLPYFHPTTYGDVAGNTLYETKNEVNVPPAIGEAVQQWANAWAVGDSEKLKALAGDGSVGAYYPGLGGCEAGSVKMLSTYPSSSETWVIRARVPLTCANGYSSLMDLDVTAVGNPPSPTRIVGWGPIGSGVLGPDSVRVTS